MGDAYESWSVNPIALARLMVEGIPVQSPLWRDVEEMLQDAFAVKDVAQIFDAESGEPARLQLFEDLVAAIRDRKRLADIELKQPVRDAIERFGRDRIIRVLPYLVPVTDAEFAPAGAPHSPDAPGRYVNIAELGDYIVGDVSYLDPIQGNAGDCYLISAISALAWSRPIEWAKRVRSTAVGSGATGTYQFEFFSVRDDKKTSFPVAPTVVLNEKGQPAYAYSFRFEDRRYEAWAAMYEKAFVMNCRCASADPKLEDYRWISEPEHRLSPEVACRMLWGGAEDIGCYNASEDVDKAPKCITDRCDSDSRKVTKVPTMAWTGKFAPGGLNWRTSGLHERHAYAVLGIMRCENRDHVVRDHIILRNPWGVSPTRPAGYADGTWKPGAGANGQPEVQLNQNGVFAIRADWFNKGFKTVGWVDL